MFGGGVTPSTATTTTTGGTTSIVVSHSAQSSSTQAQRGRKEIPGFDPDTSTEARVINTYDLDPGTVNMLGIRHRSAYNKYSGKKYKEAFDEFKELVNMYNGNYLSAYWAGRAAHMLKNNEESLEWMDRALKINPQYKPASDFKRDTLKK